MTDQNTAILVPAYSRKYATVQDMMEDWHAESEFKLVLSLNELYGPVCSIKHIKQLEADFDKLVLVNAYHDMSQIELQLGPSELK